MLTKVTMAEAAAETDVNAGNISTLMFLENGPTFTYINPEMMSSFPAIYGLYGGDNFLILLLTN